MGVCDGRQEDTGGVNKQDTSFWEEKLWTRRSEAFGRNKRAERLTGRVLAFGKTNGPEQEGSLRFLPQNVGVTWGGKEVADSGGCC